MARQQASRQQLDNVRRRLGLGLTTSFLGTDDLCSCLTLYLDQVAGHVRQRLGQTDMGSDTAIFGDPHLDWIGEAQGMGPLNYLPRNFIPLSELGNAMELRLSGQSQFKTYFPKNRRIVILGPAGQGKSEELKAIARKTFQERAGIIPIFKRFHNYEGQELKDFIPQGWDHIPDTNLLFIFDGLDEIGNAFVYRAIEAIEQFSDLHDQSAFIVSCRSNFYDLPISGKRGHPGRVLSTVLAGPAITGGVPNCSLKV